MPDDLFTKATESTDNSVFNEGSNRPNIDPNKNYLEDLVGEGRKFKTVEDLARGKAESDAFINSLLREKAEVLEELNKRLTVEDLLDKLEKRNGQGDVTNTNGLFNTSGQNQTEGSQNPDGNQLDLEKIKEAIKADMIAEQKRQQAQQNLAQVQEKLLEMYGTEAQSVLNTKAQELGVSLDRLKEIASESPKMFLATLGQPTQRQREDVFAPPNRVNSTAINSQETYGEYKPLSYWQKLKNTDRKKYFDPKTSIEMHKHALKLGDKFFDL